MKRGIQLLMIVVLMCSAMLSQAQNMPYVSKVWVADNGNGTYKNPVLHADYSDPDAIRVGDTFYMIASSFDAVPGLPVLQSKDLVNWKLITHILPVQLPVEHFSKTQHGNGVWAPAIRYRNGQFYVYYPDPDFGIYLTTAKNIMGPWSAPKLILPGKGIIDPCPFWDDNGNAYLIHAFAGSRAGIKSVLVIKKMNKAGDSTLDKGVLVYDGHETDPTIEGPKLYKRNGYYYIFAPAGGVSTGWQLVLRSKNIYGPYERKVVMQQGKTNINGPHQGAWVNTVSGEDWFLHFQDIDAYGRVVHLQPMQWINNWPVIGVDEDKDGTGEPVMTYKKPNTPKQPIETPAESDEFDQANLGLQWQWQANPSAFWAYPNISNGSLKMFTVQQPANAKSLWDIPNVLMQKFPAEEFTIVTKCKFTPRMDGEKFGIVVMGLDYASLSLTANKKDLILQYNTCTKADKGNVEQQNTIDTLSSTNYIYFQIRINKGAVCEFSYSNGSNNFKNIPGTFTAKPGKWIGAKIGFFCTRDFTTNDSGYADIDWFRVRQ